MIRGVLLDIGGVVYVGDELLPSALEALERLRRARVPVRYITNTTRRTRDAIRARLADMGLKVRAGELFTAPLAARSYIEAHELHPQLIIHPELEPEFPEFRDGPFDSVLVGDAGDAFTYARLNVVFRLLLEGAPLLAMGNNRFFRETDGFSLDVGAFVKALEFSAGIEAIVLGKPAQEFFHAALDSLDCDPGDAVMVGDDAEADVGGAMDAGLQGILVQTGKYRQGDEGHTGHDEAKVVPDLPAAVEWILENFGAPP